MSTINDYLKNITPEQKAEFERIRKIVHSYTENVEETISYGIPTFKYNGKHLLYFGAFKNHMSLFPGMAIAKALENKLQGYKISKGTIHFTAQKPIAEPIIKELLQLRLDNISKS
jgi:uncharacterized protein YdhG (YjbR/CyaY superfamily)